MSEFRVGKQTIRNLSACRYAVAAGHVGMDNTEIVNTDVCELRATSSFADCPNTGSRRLESLVDPDVSAVRQLDSREL